MLVKDAINQYFPYPLADYVLTELIKDDEYYNRMKSPGTPRFDTTNVAIAPVKDIPCIEIVATAFGGNTVPRQLLRNKKYTNDQEYLKDLMTAMLADESYKLPQPIEISPINQFKQMLENL